MRNLKTIDNNTKIKDFVDVYTENNFEIKSAIDILETQIKKNVNENKITRELVNRKLDEVNTNIINEVESKIKSILDSDEFKDMIKRMVMGIIDENKQ